MKSSVIFLALALLSVGFSACGHSASDEITANPRIVNGSEKGTNFPEVSQLYINRADSTWVACSGAWIGKTKFLTAAHCVTDTTGLPVRRDAAIVLAEYNGELFSQESIRVDVHPNYGYQPVLADDVPAFLAPAYDIAVVTFAEPYQGVTAIVTDRAPAPEDMLIIVGYGSAGASEPGYGVGRLGFTEVEAVDDYRIFWEFDGEWESNTCVGDSGGPAYIDTGSGPRLVGVTSGGTNADCSEGDLSFDTRIDSSIAWLKTVTEGDLAFEISTPAAEE